MAIVDLTIEIDLIWLEEKTDLSKCTKCNDVIYGNLHRLYVMPHSDKIRLNGSKTDFVLCGSCNELRKNIKII